MNIRIAIVDDDENECEKLESILGTWADSHGIFLETDQFHDADKLLENYTPALYQVIFLDIYMQRTNGLQAAKTIRLKDISCIIIFLTSSSLHRADALSVHAFEYLEKPLDSDRLSSVMNDALALLTPHAPFLNLLKGKQVFQIFYSDIRCILSDKQYCLIQANQDERFRVSFREIEEELADDSRFLTINRGILVNLDYVASMDGNSCIMTDGSSHPINTRRQKELKMAYVSYQFEKRTKNIHKTT